MLEEVHIIVWVEERLDSISTVDGLIPFQLWTVALETYFAESAKNCEKQSFAPVNQCPFLRFLRMVFKRKFQGC